MIVKEFLKKLKVLPIPVGLACGKMSKKACEYENCVVKLMLVITPAPNGGWGTEGTVGGPEAPSTRSSGAMRVTLFTALEDLLRLRPGADEPFTTPAEERNAFGSSTNAHILR